MAWIAASLHVGAIWARLYELRMATVNEIGDFVAGAFAPVGIIWLIVTVLQQRADMAYTRAEFAEAQRGTYYVALFDKRYQVLREAREILNAISLSGEPNEQNRKDLRSATEMATLLFGDEVPALLKTLSDKSARHGKITREIKRLKLGDDVAFQSALMELSEIEDWLYHEDRHTELEAAMLTYLRAPADPR